MATRKARTVTLGLQDPMSERELNQHLRNQAESLVVKAIVQVIDEECMAELNASLDQAQPERVCAAAAGGAAALMGVKARLAEYMGGGELLTREGRDDFDITT